MKKLILLILLMNICFNWSYSQSNKRKRFCRDELVNKAIVKNITKRIMTNYEKVDNTTIIKQLLHITWDTYIPKGLQLDGFVFKLQKSYLSGDNMYEPINVCNIGRENFWVTTNDSRCVNYTTMCAGQNTSNLLPDQRICPLNFTGNDSLAECRGMDYFLQIDDHFVVPANIQELIFDVEYRETYQFKIHPYYRQFISTLQPVSNQIEIHPTLDCSSDLQRDLNLTYLEATNLCCESDLSHTLVQNVTFSEPVADFFHDSVNVTVRWLPPISQFNLSRFTVYAIPKGVFREKFNTPSNEHYTVHQLDEETRGKLASCDNSSVYYEAVLIHLHPNVTYDVQISSRYLEPQGLDYGCSFGFCRKHTLFHVPVINPCDEKYHKCVTGANCTADDQNGVLTLNSTCTCQQGYEGNGLDKTQGILATGCSDLNYCSPDLSPCVPSAICLDNPAPNLGANCSCPADFTGDGYKELDGCSHNATVALSVAIPTIVILGILAIIIGWKIHRRRIERSDMQWSQFVANDAFRTYTANMEIGGDGDEICLPTFGEKWEIDRNLIHVENVLGRGNYGVVYQGTYVQLNDNEDYFELPVAVKMVKEGTDIDKHMADFLAEIGFMLNVGNHQNVLNVIGCCTTQKPVLLITDLLKYGDLLHFLWEAREPSICLIDPIYHITEKSLYQMARQVAEGMDYLTKSRIIHGDLAARNILVGEELLCKISDFGLANDVYRYGVIQGQSERCVPFKWISPERMMAGEVPITCKSDVWSFGNLLFEMVTLGCMPHADESSDNLLEKLRGGYRMKQPSTCSNEMYSIMSKCWAWRPSSRPSFSGITKLIDRQLNTIKDKDYVNLASAVEELDKADYQQEINHQKEDTHLSGADDDVNDDVMHLTTLSKETEKSNGRVNHAFATPV